MPRIVINAQERIGAPVPESWGELLALIEQEQAAEGQLVTAARFDGVDQPSFRDGEATIQAVRPIGVIEVEAASPRTLVSDAITEAIAAIDQLMILSPQIGSAFRANEVAGASGALAGYGANLQGLLGVLGLVSQVLHVDLGQPLPDGINGTLLVEQLGSQLADVVKAQEDSDWVTLADLIEFDIEPSLKSWRSLFTGLGRQIQ